MPADWRARRVFGNQRLGERRRIERRPLANPIAIRQEKRRKRRTRLRTPCVVAIRPAEVDCSPSGDDATHLDAGKLESRDLTQKLVFLRWREKVWLIDEPRRVSRCVEERALQHDPKLPSVFA